MSMISSLIDELRRMADGQATYRDARAVMLQAADTIWQLRDDLQRANAENAKLRELARWAARILTGILPYVDYSRCTAPEAVAAWKVEASKLGIEVDE